MVTSLLIIHDVIWQLIFIKRNRSRFAGDPLPWLTEYRSIFDAKQWNSSNCGFEKIRTCTANYHVRCVWTFDTEQTAKSGREDGRIVISDFCRDCNLAYKDCTRNQKTYRVAGFWPAYKGVISSITPAYQVAPVELELPTASRIVLAGLTIRIYMKEPPHMGDSEWPRKDSNLQPND